MSRISELVSEAVLTAVQERGEHRLARRRSRPGRTIALGVVAEDEIAKSDLDSHPLLVGERRPDVVRRRDRVLVGPEDDLGLFVVDVDGSEEENETGEGGVGRDGLEPVVVEVGKHHLGLTRSEDLRKKKELAELSRDRKSVV